jgi:hypothetical protein
LLAHVRRNSYDIHVATQSPAAAEALARIGELYGIEEQVSRRSPPADPFKLVAAPFKLVAAR